MFYIEKYAPRMRNVFMLTTLHFFKLSIAYLFLEMEKPKRKRKRRKSSITDYRNKIIMI